MTDKTVRFITAWDGRKPGDVETFEDTDADALIDGGLATDDLDCPDGSYVQQLVEHAAAHGAMASWGALTSQVNALAVLHLYGSGAPVDYTDGTPPATGEGVAPAGALYSDTTSGFVYRNSGSQAEPIWTKLADAA
jgi:hypothetical protein